MRCSLNPEETDREKHSIDLFAVFSASWPGQTGFCEDFAARSSLQASRSRLEALDDWDGRYDWDGAQRWAKWDGSKCLQVRWACKCFRAITPRNIYIGVLSLT